MATIQQLYDYTFEIYHVIENKSTTLSKDLLKYIVIDYDYDSSNMPIIYINMAVTREDYYKLVYNVDKSYISLVINKKQRNSTLPVWTTYIESRFTYFILSDSTDSYQESTTSETQNAFNGDNFKTIELALLKTDILNNTKKVYNTVLNNVTLIDAIHYGTYHIPMIIEPVNSVYLDDLIIPPITSTSKYIKYINSINELYDTPYRFFIDFNRGYLLSSEGRSTPAIGDMGDSVVISEENMDVVSAKYNGQEYDDVTRCYTIRLTKTDVTETQNNITNKSVNNLIGISTSGKTISKDLNSLEDTYSTERTSIVRINNENMESLTNAGKYIEDNSLLISFSKSEIDTSVITPNMEYNFKSSKSENYNGRYLLSKKREIFKKTDDDTFICDITITMRKIMS